MPTLDNCLERRDSGPERVDKWLNKMTEKGGLYQENSPYAMEKEATTLMVVNVYLMCR